MLATCFVLVYKSDTFLTASNSSPAAQNPDVNDDASYLEHGGIFNDVLGQIPSNVYTTASTFSLQGGYWDINQGTTILRNNPNATLRIIAILDEFDDTTEYATNAGIEIAIRKIENEILPGESIGYDLIWSRCLTSEGVKEVIHKVRPSILGSNVTNDVFIGEECR